MSSADGNRLASLLLDEPADVDLLSFDAVAGTVVDALLDDTLDPIALGLTGSWGSGKTTILRLISEELQRRATNTSKALVISTDPWRYDPQVGAKESLIGEVLEALSKELDKTKGAAGEAKKLLKSLTTRVDWTKAFTIAAKASITLQLPSIDQVLSLLKPPTDGDTDSVASLSDFRTQFAKVLADKEFKHISTVVVLVDDLDRCLPETVIETLEAIRLFLSVPKMSFVIAADEDRIAEAISRRFGGDTPTPRLPGGGEAESPSRLYLHKIVQTSVPVPAMSDFDTHVFLTLLQIQSRLTPEEFTTLVSKVVEARKAGMNVDEIDGLSGVDFSEEVTFAARLKPILHEKTRGNPRRIKRFLNDLAVRLSIASRRGIELEPAKIAKLMILEIYSPADFTLLLQWVAENQLRERLSALEAQTGHGEDDSPAVQQPQRPRARTKPRRWLAALRHRMARNTYRRSSCFAGAASHLPSRRPILSPTSCSRPRLPMMHILRLRA